MIMETNPFYGFRHKKVKFKEKLYWLHDFNLSPLDHYTDSGDLIANPFIDISYAIINNGKIMRFSEIIGDESELEEIK